MGMDQRNPMQTQQSYHAQIPPIISGQDAYGQSRYPPPVGQAYGAMQPQSGRTEYPPQPQQQQQQQQHQQQQHQQQQQQHQQHQPSGYGYASPSATSASSYASPSGASSSTYGRYSEPTYTAAPPPQGLYGGQEPAAAVPRPYAALPPLDASSQHHSWHQQHQQSTYYGPTDSYTIPDPRAGNNYERVEGRPGYPPKAPSRGPKQRFTAEDDDLLRKLKEDYTNPRLSWKQIADFFPDRNSGTLQVRYCTKLKRKDEIRWTEEADRKLMKLYREDRDAVWRRVSQKMGTGASEEHCRERHETLTELLEAMELKRGGVTDGDDVDSVRG